MKAEAIGHNIIVNGKIQETKNTKIFESIEKPPIYEVIRVINGVPLFYEEHLSRMNHSADIINSDLGRKEEEIKQDISRLIHKNDIINENIKLLSTQLGRGEKVFIVYQIESFYPPKDYYTQGIKTILIDYERKEPNAKIMHSSFRQSISAELKKNNAFEALLVNKRGDILEGSRSNVFFVKDDKVYTSRGKDVLLGVTRSQIFNICKKLNIEVLEENIKSDQIIEIEGAFMTGTSVNVLPISIIEENHIDSIFNRIIIEINNQYAAEMENYILINQDKWK